MAGAGVDALRSLAGHGVVAALSRQGLVSGKSAKWQSQLALRADWSKRLAALPKKGAEGLRSVPASFGVGVLG